MLNALQNTGQQFCRLKNCPAPNANSVSGETPIWSRLFILQMTPLDLPFREGATYSTLFCQEPSQRLALKRSLVIVRCDIFKTIHVLRHFTFCLSSQEPVISLGGYQDSLLKDCKVTD